MNSIHTITQAVKNLFGVTTTQKRMVPAHSFVQKNVLLLENRLRGAIKFLQQTRIKKNGNSQSLNRLPWYLLIGSSRSGKTALLANSGINFVLDKQFHHADGMPEQKNMAEDIPASEHCDWWATKDLVLVDVPGHYVHPDQAQDLLLSSFYDLIKKNRGSTGISGAIVTISITDLINRQQREEHIEIIANNIALLKEKFGADFPIYFILTKADLLPGFIEFFQDSSSDEIAQSWGVPVPNLPTKSALLDIVATRLNALVKRLNQQLLFRLHQEHDPFARIFIKDFPLQVERLKDIFLDVLKSLLNRDIFNLKGIYLTSVVQGDAGKIIYPHTVPADEFQRSLQILHTPTMPKQAYFIKQFILQALVPTKPHSSNPFLKLRLRG